MTHLPLPAFLTDTPSPATRPFWQIRACKIWLPGQLLGPARQWFNGKLSPQWQIKELTC